jgi:hypothetical protein
MELIAQLMHEGRRSIQRLCDDQDFCVIAAPIDGPVNIWINLNNLKHFTAFAANRHEHLSGN